MNNDLKNFLGEEYKGFGIDYKGYVGFVEGGKFCCKGDFCEGHKQDMEDIKNHDTRLINFILELVEKEVEKMIVNTPEQVMELNKHLPSTLQTQSYNQSVGYVNAVNEVSTIINSLKV